MSDRLRHTVVMATTSYPRFSGDGVGSFIEPIAHGIAARGHDVHIVAPWHPLIRRPDHEGRVRFHFFRYAPLKRLSLFGYAASLKADVTLRPTTYLVTPFALVAWWRCLRHVVRRYRPSIIHAHWVVPGGFLAAASRTNLPIVISLHGSDVFVAEANPAARQAARYAFRRASWVTACSDDLRRRAVTIGAIADRTEVVPYGVDTDRFKPDLAVRARVRQAQGITDAIPVVVAAGRLVRKKGFEYLIDAIAQLKPRWPTLTVWLAGSGDLEPELRQRVISRDVADRVTFLGGVPQDEIGSLLAAADIVIVPSVHDDAGNVDGLPNILLEALASGTPVVATPAGGITTVARNDQTARIVPERDPDAIAIAIEEFLNNPKLRAQLGAAARTQMCGTHTWEQMAKRFEETYARATEKKR